MSREYVQRIGVFGVQKFNVDQKSSDSDEVDYGTSRSEFSGLEIDVSKYTSGLVHRHDKAATGEGLAVTIRPSILVGVISLLSKRQRCRLPALAK